MSDRPSPTVPDRGLKRSLRQIAFGLAVLGFLSVPLLWVSGGFDVHLLGVEVRAHRPLRGVWLFVVGLIGFVALGGRVRPRVVMVALRDYAAQWERAVLSVLPTPRTTALLLAATVGILGYIYGTRSAGGADAYGYVSQADLWLSGQMGIPQPFAADVPWPRARETFMPLGYKGVIRDGIPSLVPTYSPGLPLIFAVFKAVGGHDALFLVPPLLGALLVIVTYGIGRRLGSAGAGLIGAALVAASPAVLFMLMPPMTDVPVAAMWASAFFVLTGPGGARALAAGAIAGLAVMIRPNLVPLAACAGLYYVPDLFTVERRRALRHGLLFVTGLLPGIVAVGAINNELYGSPFLSGYGRLSDLFAWAHIGPNFRRYYAWFVETQSHVALMGLAALLLPIRWLWPDLKEKRRLVIAALFAYSVWAQYLAYLVFDAWWYLRFLLTAWPFIMVGLGAVAMALWRPGVRILRVAVVAGLALLLFFQLGVVARVTIFNQWSGERRYIAVARMVEDLTPPNSVIFCMQHSGTIRYYGSRMTLRYDQLDHAWLDRAVQWLNERGIRSYLVLEAWEGPEVAQRFTGSAAVARLDLPPLAVFEEPSKLSMYDLSSPAPPGFTRFFRDVDRSLKAVPPRPAPPLNLAPGAN